MTLNQDIFLHLFPRYGPIDLSSKQECGKIRADRMWEILWLHWVVADTGRHGGRCGTSGPAARANSVALGGLQYVYQ